MHHNRLLQGAAEVQPAETLGDLKAAANAEFAQHKKASQRGAEHAIKCGRHLIKIKDRLPHGQFGRWLDENFEGSSRLARYYMHLGKLPDSKTAMIADLSLAGALKAATEEPVNRPDNMPPLEAGARYLAEVSGGDIIEVEHSAKYPGYWYVAKYDAELNHCDYSRRPLNFSIDGTREAVTAVYGIPNDVKWCEVEASDQEPWFVTEPLADGRSAVTLCEPVGEEA